MLGRMTMGMVAAYTLAACVPGSSPGDSGGDAGAPDPGGEPWGECPAPVDHAGTYDSDGVWDLSAPLNDDRGLGDLLTEALLDESIAIMGIPSLFEDEARALLDEKVGDAMRGWINGSAPDEWLRQDSFVAELLALTARVEVQTRIVLEAGPDVTGVEELLAFRVEHDGVSYELDPQTLTGATVPAPVKADWNGTAGDARLSVDGAAFSVRYGELVLAIASQVLGADAQEAFTARMTAAVDCAGLADELAGDGQLEIAVGSYTYAIAAAPLDAACDAALASLLDSGLGLFDPDTGIVLGGEVRASDDDCDGITDRLTSIAGYGGILEVGGPATAAPRIAVSFTASRAPQ